MNQGKSSYPPDSLREDLARLLPSACATGLSADRHRELRRSFMQQLDAPRAQRAPLRIVARRRTVIALGGIAVVAAAIVGVGSMLRSMEATTTPQTPAAVVKVVPASSTPAGPVLARIAYAAAHAQVLAPRPDQFVYVKSLIAFAQPKQAQTLAGASVLGPLHGREVWRAQQEIPAPGSSVGIVLDGKPQQALVTAYLRENGSVSPVICSELGTTYAKLAALPTDPATLLRALRARSAGHGDANAAAFAAIGELLREQLLPPQLGAALYRAAAMIPGVLIVPDAVDAAGRHGFGVARVANGERSEWIFDRHTFAYLGERDYLVRNTAMGKAGMVTGTTAVLERGVVDKPGELPATSASASAPN